MIQIPPAQFNEATGDTLDILSSVKKTIGSIPNLIATMANSSAVVSGYLAFSQSLAKGSLSGKLREKIALTVGETNHCDYCVAAHSSIGLRAGLSKTEIILARKAASEDSKENTALQFAKAIVIQRGKLDSSAINRLRLAGYSDGEIVEIVGHVALNIFTNYFNHIAGTEVDFPKVPKLDNSITEFPQ